MIRTLFCYQLVFVALVWLYVMLHWAWPSDCATTQAQMLQAPPAYGSIRSTADNITPE